MAMLNNQMVCGKFVFLGGNPYLFLVTQYSMIWGCYSSNEMMNS